MLYNRSLEIERRLDDVLKLVREGQQSAPTLAKALNISKPTVSRCLRALRNRGHAIRAVKRGETWSYELEEEQSTQLEEQRV
jgi:biotin operon repressor